MKQKYVKPVLIPLKANASSTTECHSGGSADSCRRGYHD
jgi:hypothetical protein